MLKPVCVPCQRFFRLRKGGVMFVEGMPKFGTQSPQPGTAEPDKWQPYKLWQGDLWGCPNCGAEILSGFGAHPWAERHHEDFEKAIAVAKLQINDC